MAKLTKTRSRTWTLDVQGNYVDITSERWTPNEQWKFTDANGHQHHYDHGYPSLDLVIDESHWCDGTEGIAPHDPHEAVDKSHYECKLCRVVVTPAKDPPYTPKSLFQSWDATLKGMHSDGRKVTIAVIPSELDEIRATDGDEAAQDVVVQRILDAAPDERITSWSFSS